jgi:hypothetical protein
MTSYVPSRLRRAVSRRARYACEYCLIAESDTVVGCQVDHVVSEKHGGHTDSSNLAYACAFCNRFKGSDVGSLDKHSGALVRLFNPRTDRWGDHFELDGAHINARTDIGAVTVELLRINSFERVLERESLIAVDRYPPQGLRGELSGGSRSSGK